MSASSFHKGFASAFAYKSQTALTAAAVAKWTTPFSGPSQRNWLSPVIKSQNAAMSSVNDSRVLPTSRSPSARAAAQQSSLPRPMVKASPCPSRPSAPSVRKIK